MSQSEFSRIPVEKLVDLCSRGAYTLDGLWFTLLEKEFGLEKALEIDTEVWKQLCLTQARRVLKYFSIAEPNPIRKVIKVIQLDPLLFIYKPQVVKLTDSRAVLRMTDCPPQKARIRDGRGEFPCKSVGIGMLQAYAQVIDPRIKLGCATCPPDAHPDEFWCEWHFELQR